MTENEALYILNNYKFDMRQNGAFDMITTISFVTNALKELQHYREIGTVEKCREAVEKQKAKKPEIYTDTVQTMNGSFQRDVFECPVCGDYVCNVEDEIPRYCQSCGQKLEESEGE